MDFRPRLPLDPFDDEPAPWLISAPPLPTPLVVLVLGAPHINYLLDILKAPSLAHSLVLIVTHHPPPLADESCSCTVRILRLHSPLLVHDNGAVTLASVFERAERISRQWRKSPSGPRLLQLVESGPGGEFTVQEQIGFKPPESPDRRSSRPSSSLSLSSTSSSLSRKQKVQLRSDRPFDAVINFIPSGLPEKAMLKQSILVTTLSHPFLSSPPAFLGPPALPTILQRMTPSEKAAKRHSTFSGANSSGTAPMTPRPKRWSMRSGRPESIYVPGAEKAVHSAPSSPFNSYDSLVGTRVTRKAHIVHVLGPQFPETPTKPKLAQSIERFLISYSYHPSYASTPIMPQSRRSSSATSVSSCSSTSSRSSTYSVVPPSPRDGEKAAPYVLRGDMLGYIPRPQMKRRAGQRELSLIELVILGGLDRQVHIPRGEAGPSLLDGLMDGELPRAWIGSGKDVRFGVEEELLPGIGLQPSAASSAPAVIVPEEETGLPTPPDSGSSESEESTVGRRRSVLVKGTKRRIGLLSRLKFW